MNGRGTGLALLLALGAGSLVLGIGSASTAWIEPRTVIPPFVPWVLSAAILIFLVAGFLGRLQSTSSKNAAGAANLALEAKLDGLRLRLEKLSSAQGRFVGNIAHEIKTPLTTVLIQTDVLLACSDDPLAVRTHTRGIVEDVRHISDLVESFLRLARPFAQEDRSQHLPVFFYDCLLEAVRRSQSLARAGEVSVAVSLAEASPDAPAVEILGDAVLLEAMIENLVRNALRFSPRGGRVELRVEADAERVLLFVRDHGTGIDASHLESVFDWFFREPDSALPSSGNGFGLAIVKRVAEHHGGTIELRNHPQGGCEFRLSFPRWTAAAEIRVPEAHDLRVRS